MAKDPAFLLYYKDFDNDTANWEPEALGWFMRLLFFQAGNGYIPSDIEEVAQIARVKFSEFEKFKNIWENRISVKFSDTLSDTLKMRNERLFEIQKDRKQNALKKSILAVFGNYIKSTELSDSEVSHLKKEFRKTNDFEAYSDSNERKDRIIEFLELTIHNYRQRNAKRTQYANEDEDVIVNKDKDKKGGAGEKDKIKLPYDSEKFKTKWDEWKEYKSKEHRFRYKTTMSEEAALSKLANLARGEPEAIQIIQEAIANGWKGFFPLKQNNHENKKPDPRFDDRRSKFEGASKRRGTVKFT